MKKFLTGLFLFCIASQGVQADLVDEVDELSPEEAAQVRRKLLGKMYDPMPMDIFSKVGLRIGAGLNDIEFTGTLPTDFVPVTNYISASGVLQYQITDRFGLGVEGGGALSSTYKKVGGDAAVMKGTDLETFYAHLVGNFVIYRETAMAIKITGGLGWFNGSYKVSRHDETTGSSSFLFRQGTTYMSYQLGMEALYYLNPIWSVGFGVSYFYADIPELKTMGGDVPAEKTGMRVSSPMIKIFTGFYI